MLIADNIYFFIPCEDLSLIWRHHQCQWTDGELKKFRLMLDTYGSLHENFLNLLASKTSGLSEFTGPK
jgi:hypothetical protein